MTMLDSETIVPLYATLNADGSVEVGLLVPGQDDPVEALIPSMRATKALAIPECRRVIELDADGDAANKELRALVLEFVTRSEERRLSILGRR